MADKPRILQGNRDMIWSLVPLLLICLVVAFASGSVSFGMGGDASDDKTAPFDVVGALETDARVMDFPVRMPTTPEEWKPNSGSTQIVGGQRTSNVGWLTPQGSYVQLTQTNATEEALVAHLGDGDALGDGQRDAGGASWVVYQAEKKKFWITDLGDVRIAVVSRGSDADIDILASSVASKEPLPTQP